MFSMPGIIIKNPIKMQDIPSYFVEPELVTPNTVSKKAGNFIIFSLIGEYDNYWLVYVRDFKLDSARNFCPLSETNDEKYVILKISIADRQKYSDEQLLDYIDSGFKSIVGVDYPMLIPDEDTQNVLAALNISNTAMLFILNTNSKSGPSEVEFIQPGIFNCRLDVTDDGIGAYFKQALNNRIKNYELSIDKKDNFVIFENNNPFIAITQAIFVSNNTKLGIQTAKTHGIQFIEANIKKQHLRSLNTIFNLELTIPSSIPSKAYSSIFRGKPITEVYPLVANPKKHKKKQFTSTA